MSTNESNPDQPDRAWPWFALLVGGGVLAEAVSWQSILSFEATAAGMLSPGLWRTLVESLGGRIVLGTSGLAQAEIDFLPLVLCWIAIAALCCSLAACLTRSRSQLSWRDSFTSAGFACAWWWLMGAWELARLLAFALDWQGLEQLLLASPAMWQALTWAGCAAQPFVRCPKAATTRSATVVLAAMIATYVVIFTAMNWRLWFNLRIPHGDSAMYEEHLWNLWHGKGFRSYLDQGLFLGEHIQVVHLLLLPLHVLWPSHLLLELCESTALAIGAVPIFRMTRRSTGSDRAALLMAGAYLLYFPLHFLDIEVDLKTFRPESFCVPFFLFAFEALEAGRWRRMLWLLAIALSAKEDYSIIIAPLGVWIAARAWFDRSALSDPHSVRDSRRDRLICGFSLAAFGVVYLGLATRVVIPWFRGGEELHYVRYFSKFGNTMNEVVWNMLTNPRLLFGELLTPKTAMYGASLLLPVGFVALLSPGRLAVGLPLFGILCLNELAQDPRHHFHAPLVPVVFWATAVGVSRAGTTFSALRRLVSPSSPADSFARQFVWTSAFASGLFFSLGPAGISFWDPHSAASLWRLYAHDPRADQISKVLAQIPITAKVAATDFVHPRFTHHERSYDYSHYRRRVSGYGDRVPDDTDFIVIDTRHPYSDIKTPVQVRELRFEPERWKLLPDLSDGYFILLQRR